MRVAQPLPIGFFFCFVWKLPPLALPRLLVIINYHLKSVSGEDKAE